MRMRSDLTVGQHIYLGRKYWVVKDPLAQKYYRFEEEEFALLEMLDGVASLQDVQAEFERRFAPQKIPRYGTHIPVGLAHIAHYDGATFFGPQGNFAKQVLL